MTVYWFILGMLIGCFLRAPARLRQPPTMVTLLPKTKLNEKDLN